ncbi:MAG: serine/threonine protein kinase [Pyrinomonadaceae bacterium]|nr:serine/threonine protein kinase [Pyrinomonadaceae bacterium]
MQPERWKEIKEILDKALQLDPSARVHFLNELDTDEEVKSEVVSLLVDLDEAEDFLSAPASSLAGEFLPEEESVEDPNLGEQIGNYRIVSELGLGGMGAVYLAERTDGEFTQQVAIKLLKREFNTKRIRETFARERDIQGGLAHPNIATLIDAGTTNDGIPFLIMELVEGVPIDRYCREKNLNLGQRLKLFNKACEAVSFAHRNLIVHRDLKPSNILVTEDGEPMLLDFGISKLLDEDGHDSSTVTNIGALTPKYASPEQITGEPITTATDIFSLGVILYKILTGRHPFTNSSDESGVLSAIVERDPTLPSASTRGNGTERDLETEKIIDPAKLRGDLDNILLMAIRKKPERRYATVEQFRDDIWRYLDNLPVRARPATLTYRARKFLSRNKIPVAAGLLTLLGLIVGLSVALWQANVAGKQALIAKNAQQRAEVEAKKSKAEEETAKEISKFMDKLISFANPGMYAAGSKESGNARVIDAIDAMGASIEREIPDRKDIQAELHHKFAEVYVMLAGEDHTIALAKSYLRKANFHARRALNLRIEHFGNQHELVAKDLYYMWAAKVPSEKSPAVLLSEAIDMMRATNPKNLNLPQMLASYANRVHTIGTKAEKEEYRKAAKSDKDSLALAQAYFLESLKLFQEKFGEDDISVVLVKCRTAMVMADRGRIDELRPFYNSCKNPPSSFNKNQMAVVTDLVMYIENSISDSQNR